MSDFIFSADKIKKNIITQKIQSIYDKNLPEVYEFHGKWGSAGVSVNPYNGFLPFENNVYITIVVGGPLLMFRDNIFLSKEDSNEGTQAIFERWNQDQLKFETDLSGPFSILIINKETSEITSITDLMSFIPVYEFNNSTNIMLSTHVDILAELTGEDNQYDKVSIADFILHGITTFPYTIYENISQINPAFVYKFRGKHQAFHSRYYWLPREEYKYKSLKEAARNLDYALNQFITKITNETNSIAQFVSGGEDSRMLSGMLYGHDRDGHIFLDDINREGKIAQTVAKAYDINLRITTRDPMHYLEILPDCSTLVGSGSQYHHAHTYGFHKSCELDSYTAVFGGLLSDALLKGFRVNKIKGSSRFPFIPDIKTNNNNITNNLNTVVFNDDILKELKQRRQNHLNYIKKFRKNTANEWFMLWPISMNSSSPNIHANRRLFCSYEPFISSEVVKLSASIPQSWKLNRKLFHYAAKPYLKRTKWLFHGKGTLPYYSWKINTFIHFNTWLYRKIAQRTGILKGNQGPWGDWRKMVRNEKWDDFVNNYKDLQHQIPFVENDKQLIQMINNKELKVNQYVNLTQVLYEINKNN